MSEASVPIPKAAEARSAALADPGRHRLAQLMVVLDVTVMNLALLVGAEALGFSNADRAVDRDGVRAVVRQPACCSAAGWPT